MPKRTLMVEVRCCCQPTKVLGRVPLEEQYCVEGRQVSFFLGFERERWRDLEAGITNLVDKSPAFVSLPIARFATPEQPRGWLAVRAEGTSIETLRQIPGFVEAETAGSARMN